MTRLQIEQQAYRMLGKNATSPDTETQTRMRGWLDNRLRRVLSLNGMDRLRRETFTFASIANQDRYGLPLSVAKVERIVDRLNYWTLQERDINWLRNIEPNPATSGTPEAYVLFGYQAVQIQPSNASSLFVKSDSGSDTMIAYVEGFSSGGLPLSAQVALTGTTAVAFPGITNWEVVTKFYIASAGSFITLTEDSGAGTTLAQISGGKTSSLYQSLILWPTPASARTYHCDVERTITTLAQDTDTPPWSEDFHDILVYGVCADECLKMDDNRRIDFEAQYAARLKDLKMWLWNSASDRPVSGRDGRIGHSNLGGWYPADFYL